jgi:hypothetical protein
MNRAHIIIPTLITPIDTLAPKHFGGGGGGGRGGALLLGQICRVPRPFVMFIQKNKKTKNDKLNIPGIKLR